MPESTQCEISLRELGPGEDAVLDAVFAGLSPTSRLMRYLGPVPALTPTVRRALTAVDGHRHLAVAAFAGRRAIGIARLVRETPDRAELAVEVVDRWQHRGIGSRLVQAVLVRGREAGIVTVVADVSAENIPVLRMQRALAPEARSRPDGAEIRLVADVAAPVLPAAA